MIFIFPKKMIWLPVAAIQIIKLGEQEIKCLQTCPEQPHLVESVHSGGGWNEMNSRVPPNPKHSVMILEHMRQACGTRLPHYLPLIKEGVLWKSNKDLQDPGLSPGKDGISNSLNDEDNTLLRNSLLPKTSHAWKYWFTLVLELQYRQKIWQLRLPKRILSQEKGQNP